MKLARTDLAVITALALFALVPVIGGVVRLISLGEPVTSDNARFVAAPGPVVVHVVASTLYAVLGGLQLVPGIRRGWPRWHRGSGRLVAVAGLVAALTGMWMAAFTPIPEALQGAPLRVVRLAVGGGMVTALVLGVASILRRDVRSHEAWMIRAYALGMGAGTQAVVLGPVIALTGEALGTPRDVAMTLAWAINLAIAEWFVRRPRQGALRAVPA